jgi:hypothetical protein
MIHLLRLSLLAALLSHATVVEFASPSAAAAVIHGGHANGLTA